MNFTSTINIIMRSDTGAPRLCLGSDQVMALPVLVPSKEIRRMYAGIRESLPSQVCTMHAVDPRNVFIIEGLTGV